jgi:hypothetical protein
MVNYEGADISEEQIQAFRDVLKGNWEESLAKHPMGTAQGWNEALLEITEGRKSQYDKSGKRTFFYSWCGDWVSYHLWKTGCRHKCLNREAINGKWEPGMNLTFLTAWAGDHRWLPKAVKERYSDDPSSGSSWHPWDNTKDACEDGYEPRLGDLVICPRKNGDHIEFWAGREDKIIKVSAGAQAGGVALLRTRDLDIEELVAIVDIDKLVCKEPF